MQWLARRQIWIVRSYGLDSSNPVTRRRVDVNTFRIPEKPANISNANSIKRRRIRMRRNSVRIGPLFLTNLVSNSVEIVAGPRRGKTRGMRGRKSREERSPHNRVISSLGTQVNSDTRIPGWENRKVAVRVAPWSRNFSPY